MVKKGSSLSLRHLDPARNSPTCSRASSDRVVGMTGVRRASAALNTFSDTSERVGGQSRNRYW
jgi:hypothetical protein